jgi:hypothetical protein
MTIGVSERLLATSLFLTVIHSRSAVGGEHASFSKGMVFGWRFSSRYAIIDMGF